MADPSRPVTGYPAYPNGGPPPAPSSGQAYAYAAPPPATYPHHYPNPYYSRPQLSRLSFLRAFIGGIIVLFIISAVITFIFWLVLRPRLPEFRVDSLQVNNFSIASQSVSASWVVGFSIDNPNKKMIISYDVIDSSVFYKSEQLSETRIPPFTQDKRNRTNITASFSSVNSYIEAASVNAINEDRRRNALSFDVRIWARVGFRAGWWRTRRRLLRVLCEKLPVGLPLSNSTVFGKLIGESRPCLVGI